MKTAIYIEDGIVQLVITPEGDFEKNALATFQNKTLDVEIKAGSFYECQNRFIRQSHDDKDKSLILTIRKEAETKEEDSQCQES